MLIRPLEYKEGAENYICEPGVKAYSEEFDGAVRTWKEFLPSSYDGSKSIPLVLSFHGGNAGPGHDLHHAETRAAWTTVAEAFGFMVLYPQSLAPDLAWNPWNYYSEKDGLKDDIAYLDWLIDRTVEKYNIDKERIYLHGHSFGDVMGTCYVLERGERFAAAALMSGPAAADQFVNDDGSFKFGPDKALPVVKIHGSEDLMMPMGRYHLKSECASPNTCDPGRRLMKASGGVITEEMRRMKYQLSFLPNLLNWRHINSCEQVPVLSLRGDYNIAQYKGDQKLTFYSVEGGVHNPYKPMADYIWRYFFSAYKRVDGKIVRVEPERTFEPDKMASAIAEGAEKAYVRGEIKALSTKIRRFNGALCAVPEDVCVLLPELSFRYDMDGKVVYFTKGSDELQLAAGNQTVVYNNELKWFSFTRFEDGKLYVPVADISAQMLGLYSAAAYDALFISEHEGRLTYDMAYTIRELLGTEEKLLPIDCLEREKAELANKANYL